MITKFIRTCQECGHEQEARDPVSYKNDSWRDLKCKKCKSESMDYGSARIFNDDGSPYEIQEHDYD